MRSKSKTRFIAYFWILSIPIGSLFLFGFIHLFYEVPDGISTVLRALAYGSLFALIVGWGALMMISFSSWRVTQDRRQIARVFSTGVVRTQIALVAVMIAYAFIIPVDFYLIESLTIGRIHYVIILGLFVAGLYGALITFQSAMSFGSQHRNRISAVHLTREDAPQLWNRTEELADKLGALKPESILVGLDANFFVTEAPLSAISGQTKGRTMYCSLPLLRVFSKDEFDAVILHELAHFKGEDTYFSQKFFPIYRGAAENLEQLSQEASGSIRGIILLPAINVLNYFLLSFSLIEAGISRARELEADRASAEIKGGRALAKALVKVHVFDPILQTEDAADKFEEGMNFSIARAEKASRLYDSKMSADAASSSMSHPTDSHPALGVRLENLGESIESLASDPVSFAPSSPAISMIAKPEEVEQNLSSIYFKNVSYILKRLAEQRGV